MSTFPYLRILVQCFRSQPDPTRIRVMPATLVRSDYSTYISLHCKVQMIEIRVSSHFALNPWKNLCESSPWLFLTHLRIGDGRRGSCNILTVCCCHFHILYYRFCCITKFFSRLAVLLRVTGFIL
jgi:hypothetical protein